MSPATDVHPVGQDQLDLELARGLALVQRDGAAPVDLEGDGPLGRGRRVSDPAHLDARLPRGPQRRLRTGNARRGCCRTRGRDGCRRRRACRHPAARRLHRRGCGHGALRDGPRDGRRHRPLRGGRRGGRRCRRLRDGRRDRRGRGRPRDDLRDGRRRRVVAHEEEHRTCDRDQNRHSGHRRQRPPPPAVLVRPSGGVRRRDLALELPERLQDRAHDVPPASRGRG
ncbi:MAG: hypothetical protein E6J68_06755 [Deltaproteobacteria bacterium]|nr:MAG: hypothetical protein E6J68_06755 [Deltaproteobacteria bacterium]